MDDGLDDVELADQQAPTVQPTAPAQQQQQRRHAIDHEQRLQGATSGPNIKPKQPPFPGIEVANNALKAVYPNIKEPHNGHCRWGFSAGTGVVLQLSRVLLYVQCILGGRWPGEEDADGWLRLAAAAVYTAATPMMQAPATVQHMAVRKLKDKLVVFPLARSALLDLGAEAAKYKASLPRELWPPVAGAAAPGSGTLLHATVAGTASTGPFAGVEAAGARGDRCRYEASPVVTSTARPSPAGHRGAPAAPAPLPHYVPLRNVHQPLLLHGSPLGARHTGLRPIMSPRAATTVGQAAIAAVAGQTAYHQQPPLLQYPPLLAGMSVGGLLASLLGDRQLPSAGEDPSLGTPAFIGHASLSAAVGAPAAAIAKGCDAVHQGHARQAMAMEPNGALDAARTTTGHATGPSMTRHTTAAAVAPGGAEGHLAHSPLTSLVGLAVQDAQWHIGQVTPTGHRAAGAALLEANGLEATAFDAVHSAAGAAKAAAAAAVAATARAAATAEAATPFEPLAPAPAAAARRAPRQRAARERPSQRVQDGSLFDPDSTDDVNVLRDALGQCQGSLAQTQIEVTELKSENRQLRGELAKQRSVIDIIGPMLSQASGLIGSAALEVNGMRAGGAPVATRAAAAVADDTDGTAVGCSGLELQRVEGQPAVNICAGPSQQLAQVWRLCHPCGARWYHWLDAVPLLGIAMIEKRKSQISGHVRQLPLGATAVLPAAEVKRLNAEASDSLAGAFSHARSEMTVCTFEGMVLLLSRLLLDADPSNVRCNISWMQTGLQLDRAAWRAPTWQQYQPAVQQSGQAQRALPQQQQGPVIGFEEPSAGMVQADQGRKRPAESDALPITQPARARQGQPHDPNDSDA